MHKGQQSPERPGADDIFKIGGGSVTTVEATAIQLVYEGKATAGQQRMAMEVIIHKLAMADHISYTQGSFDGSAFLAGRAFVGKLIRFVLRSKLGELQ